MQVSHSNQVESLHSCLDRRSAGVLLHVSSLPGWGTTGDLGREAHRFVDFLATAGFGVWQTLPIGPTQADGSPYQTSSVHAGNPRLIALDPLLASGWLDGDSLPGGRLSDEEKRLALRRAWMGFQQRASVEERHHLADFSRQQGYWLEDYCLFQAIHRDLGGCWWQWPPALRDRQPAALEQIRVRLADEIAYLGFEQYLFFSQWLSLKTHANRRGLRLFGDMPIFVAHDSAEVWAHPEMFELDEQGLPLRVAGVPPDYFSEQGQRWGNPLYRWDRLGEADFSLWLDRLHTQLKLFDLVRIDHFRGFEAYWSIPAADQHAKNGHWVKAPGDALFARLHEEFDPLPLIAEDLGIITPEVEALRRRYRLPGMKVLQFAFSGTPDNPYLPFNHSSNSLVYTGTHDNDTSLGWYRSLDPHTRGFVDEYLGYPTEPMPWPLIRMALGTRSALAILPMQDILGLDSQHRMNLPGTTEGNWQWRFDWHQVPTGLESRLRRCLAIYGRLTNG